MMDFRETKSLNASIKTIKKREEFPCDLMIDTFRHPYLLFPLRFSWPSISMDGIHYPEAKLLVAVLKRMIPDYVEGCHILPVPRPQKNSTQLHLVRALEYEGSSYLYILKISGEYMGGASDEEILTPRRQGITPSVSTDRIYYHARILPIENVIQQGGQIVDFQSRILKDAIYEVGNGDMARDIWATILFDDIDFSKINENFRNYFSFEAQWKPGRLFYPFLVDYLTIALNMIHPTRERVDRILPHFHNLLQRFVLRDSSDSYDGKPTEEERRFWRNYYESWDYTGLLSRSGNPHWKLTAIPDLQ